LRSSSIQEIAPRDELTVIVISIYLLEMFDLIQM
jgi:hypothetical protein